MKKTQLILPFLKILFTHPSIIFKALYHVVVREDRRQFVLKEYGMSNGLPELDLFELLPGIEGTIKNFTHLYGTSLPIDMLILKNLANRFKACDYLEIGTWRGESIVNMAEACNHCVSISLSDEGMREHGFPEGFIRIQRFFSKGISNVEHIEADSKTFDFKSLNRKFDLIFVDGDHSFEAVKGDTKKVFELLKGENSIIIWHDYTEQYEIIDWEVMAGILAGTPSDKRNKIYHISNSLCAIYIKGNYKSSPYDFPAVPNKSFNIFITSEKLRQAE